MTEQKATPPKPGKKPVASEGAAAETEAVEPPTPPARPAIIDLIELRHSDPSDEDLKRLVHRHIEEELSPEDLSADYNVLVLYDSLSLERSDTDKIYRAAARTDRSKPILLIVDSGGGSISPAYFIAKLCREYSSSSFEVAVPRRAKSAATLICCGADAIHMGSLSELGPIDPQFDGVPALALKHSIEHLAELCKMHPAASDMFATYLSHSLRIEALGYYERVAASATHYAERLLKSRRRITQDDTAITGIANKLVYAYKDHGFAIDADEATLIFGTDVVRRNTREYAYANTLYHALDMAEWALNRFYNRNFAFTGSLTDGAVMTKRSK
jgi:hypothetical protein